MHIKRVISLGLLLLMYTILVRAQEATLFFEASVIASDNAIQLEEILMLTDMGGEINKIAFHPVDPVIVIVAADRVTLWDLVASRPLWQLNIETGGLLATFSPTGKQLLVATNQSLYLWSDYRDIESQLELIIEATEQASAVTDARFSQDGSEIVAVRAQIGGFYRWDVIRGELLQEQYFDFDEYNSAQFSILSPTGRLNGIVKNQSVVEIRETQHGDLLSTAYFEVIFNELVFIYPLAFSPDEELLLLNVESSSVTSIALLDVDEDSTLSQFEQQHGSIWTGVFSPNGEIVALGNRNNGEIYIWDAATGEELITLTGHTGWITSLTFNAEGTLLMSSSTDGTVRLWGIPAGGE